MTELTLEQETKRAHSEWVNCRKNWVAAWIINRKEEILGKKKQREEGDQLDDQL